MEHIDNPDLKLAFDFVQYTNRNIFLTGKAGTGKTTFLLNLKKKSPKRMVVVAPTGVAAINAGGVTIHSFFQLPFHPFVPVQYVTSVVDELTATASSSFKLSREKVNIIKSLDLLVIDEISMVRSDLLDAVDMILRRYRDHNKPFGGVQLLMIGDIHQLSPVVKEDAWELLSRYYETPFFFGSLALRSTDYVTIELKYIYRQQDQSFIELLNKVRDNQLDTQALTTLNLRCDRQLSPGNHEGYITLTTHNSQAQTINDSKLDRLPGKARLFRAAVNDDFPEYAYPTAYDLLLKTGAQVMFVKNDISRDKLYYNGKIGKITGFDDDQVIVRCPGDESEIIVTPAEWQNMKYALDNETKEIQETVIGTFTQLPLKLAWAITIHKSQGLTFDRVIIDAHAAFAHGQVYVALSRCRTLEGLILSNPISNRGIISDPVVSEFSSHTAQNQPDSDQLAASKKIYQQFLLSELFDFNPLLRILYHSKKVTEENSSSLLGSPQLMIEKMINVVKMELVTVSEKFLPQLNYLLTLNPDIETNDALQQRISQACVYFTNKLDAAVISCISGIPVETDNKSIKKSLTETLNKIKQESSLKQACLLAMMNGFSVHEYLETKARAIIDAPSVKSKISRPSEDFSTNIEYPALMKVLKAWREKKALALNLPQFMILRQNTLFALVHYLPRNMDSIKKIKGMGKVKSEKYGFELLSVINDFCSENHIALSEPIPIQTDAIVSGKKDSKLITFNLYKEGKSIPQIAQERSMSVTTIEGHLAHYVGMGEIPVSEFVSPAITELIASHFRGADNYQLSPVKAALGNQVSWSEIKFVLKHLEYSGQLKHNKKTTDH